jgi:hypothetical protein
MILQSHHSMHSLRIVCSGIWGLDTADPDRYTSAPRAALRGADAVPFYGNIEQSTIMSLTVTIYQWIFRWVLSSLPDGAYSHIQGQRI